MSSVGVGIVVGDIWEKGWSISKRELKVMGVLFLIGGLLMVPIAVITFQHFPATFDGWTLAVSGVFSLAEGGLGAFLLWKAFRA